MGRSKMTDEELTMVRKMLSEGYKVIYIASRLNIEPNCIYKMLNKTEKRVYRKWTYEEKAKMLQLRRQGISNSEIAKVLGRNRINVQQMLRKIREA